MRELTLRIGERETQVTRQGESVVIEGQTFTVSALEGGLYRVSDGTRHWTVAVAGDADDCWVFVDGQVARVEAGSAGTRARASPRRDRHRPDDLAAPMPATVVRVLADAGTAVARGETLIVLEAMKMELPIRAPRDGVVRAVHCAAGDLVQAGVPLLDLE